MSAALMALLALVALLPSSPGFGQERAGAASDRETQARPARPLVTPYIEIGQSIVTDLNGDDSVSYTRLAAGVDASVRSRRTTGQISYRYERQIGRGRAADQQVHNGLARGEIRLAPGLTIEGAGLATRARADGGVVAAAGDTRGVNQVFAIDAGPGYARRLGAVDVGVEYRIGYTGISTPATTTDGATTDGAAGTPTGVADRYDASVGQRASVRIGVRPDAVLPVGVTASAGYDRDDARLLDQRYTGYYGRGDILAPLSPYVALVGGVGYERIETGQRDAQIGADGVAVTDAAGRLVADPASPRRIAYRTAGLYYDAGLAWRPSRRTAVEGRIGRRYGSLSYTGSIAYRASRGIGMAAQVRDGIQTFGRQLRTGLGSLPIGFTDQDSGLGQSYAGCTFGTGGDSPGACSAQAFQSITSASYRSRSADAIVFARRREDMIGVGGGYASRLFFAAATTAAAAGRATTAVAGGKDARWYAQAFWRHPLGPVSGLDATAVVTVGTSDVATTGGTGPGVSAGVTGSVYRYFGRLGTTASFGLYHVRTGEIAAALSIQALLAARYRF